MISKSTIIFKFVLIALCTHSVAYSQNIYNDEAISKLKIHNEATVNSPNMESSPAFYGDKIGMVVPGKSVDKETKEAYFDLNFALVNLDNSLGEKSAFEKRINSELHEGPMAYDYQKNLLYFTRTLKEKRNIKGLETDTAYLGIMVADLKNVKPSVSKIDMEVEHFSICHPTLSKDGNTMIFSSDKASGNGKMDLYLAYLDGNTWKSVINLGNQINSPANEIFPNLMNDSILIFSSDRSGGIGGLDLYVSKMENGAWSQAQLLPKPLNSSFDDLGLIVRENGKSGYFTSNRLGGKGGDDIYRFETNVPLFERNPDLLVETQVTVLDKLTLEPLHNVKITMTPLAIDVNNFTLSSYNVDMLSGKDPGDLLLKLTPKKGKSLPSSTTNEEGIASFEVKKTQKYLVTFSSEDHNEITLIYDYATFGKEFNMVLEPQSEEDEEEKTEVVVSTDKEEQTKDDEVIIPTEKGAVVVFENIYYEYNSANIIKGAAKELDALASVMKTNEEMNVRLEAHTDSRGSTEYNQQLSINRAEAARKYLTDLGIDEDRISIKGFGESKLRNGCKDNVPCSETKHQYNRRTEVVIEN